jgi:hypothetical protein
MFNNVALNFFTGDSTDGAGTVPRGGIGRIFTLSQLSDFVFDTRGDLTILALQLAQLQELA